ncbi:MAG: rane fusion protein multidrug efflux system [Betaproteobacteria bacterium]|nr:rane fusion protein multidrug efflux system [Betaproteobacteria bacterium]
MIACRTSSSPAASRTTVLGVALLATLAALNGCSRAKPAAPAAQPPEVSVATVQRASVPVTVDLPGRTNAYFVAQVRARVDGIVLKRNFKEGSDAKVGQRLYQIDPAPYQAMLDSAQATLQKTQSALPALVATAERYKALVGNGVSKMDYDNAVSLRDQGSADVVFSKAAVQTARINLGYTSVIAPITGRIGISQVTEGAYVQAAAATLMTTVQQIDPIYVDLTQSSIQGLQLRRDIASGKVKITGPSQAKVTVTLEDGTVYPITGALQFSDITVDQNTGSVTLRAMVRNPNYVLLPGMFVRARIEEGVNDNALLVPQVAVTHNAQGQATTLVVGPDNKVALRTLQATRTFGNNWVVESGVNAGDKVIVSGIQKAQPGALVRAVDAPAATQNAGAPTQPATSNPASPQPAASQPAASGQPAQPAQSGVPVTQTEASTASSK